MKYLYSEKDDNDFYVRDDVHFPHVLTPLFASFQLPNQEEGTRRAFETLQVPLERFSVRMYRGRFYQCNIPFQGDTEERTRRHHDVMAQRLPVIMDYYQEKLETVLLPYYDQLKQMATREFSPEQALQLIQEMHRFYAVAWDIHFDIIFPRIEVGLILEDLYKKMTEATDGQPVYELLVGVMNKSLETDRAFRQLANEIKADAQWAAVVGSTSAHEMDAALCATAHGAALVQKLRNLLEVYGYRTSYSHEFVNESWVENSKYAWELIQSYVQKEEDIDAQYAALRQRRELAMKALMDGVPEGTAKQEFWQMYQYGLQCWGLDEDHHFYIDTMLPVMYRPVLRAIGRTLAGQGVIDQADDIFFLYYEEVCQSLANPSARQSLVHLRKQEYETFKQEQGEPHLGQLPPASGEEDVLVDRVFGLPKFMKENTKTFFKGYAASKGSHTGTVRIVNDQEEFSKISHGDVLVCKSTTPPWTVLFSVAGAIVTDAGGILSHAGTVAREYGIPAVLGTKVATRTLRDGDVVTVNGTEGTVVVLSA
ncbi:PEP-utilizing enzyme [Sulfoacidibacillus ferrooxidans]|uniref:Chondramide synthase cmdD n=1 Tax=Sulfoacidibacillus ferrooxidans TaxID=2005001 RepID=A0A9X1VAK7_9BACL|nr:Chondramide synthase cmdD [Sulfoacidibacillus ferrooxidans]